MKQLDDKADLWAHIICVNWTPEISFTDEFKTKINGKINLERFNITCYHCVKRKVGSSIQCDYKNCSVSRHVRCAVDSGMIFEWSKMEKLLCVNHLEDEDERDIPIFCEKHRVIGSLAFREGGNDKIK